ncbi:hypothetical protein IM543_16115 [Massilia sp. UMI-21]|nr:hypothetical protein IM543_16115 [Massilia sp. UMI-21]
MMTSTPVTQQQQTDGRTVREVVEFNQELVNEVWCRRIFRQILQSLELQYAMQMPNRPISPDTVLVLDSGDPMLLPSPEVGAAWSEAGDLYDLAAVVHYAITREHPPAAPLQGRPLGEDYSDSFVSAVDHCLAPDPQQRPRTIEQLRNLLGIVPLGPAVPPQAAQQMQAAQQVQAAQPVQSAYLPLPASEASLVKEPGHGDEQGKLKRWLMLAAAATVLMVALGALLALLHQADSRDTVMLALPDDAPAARDIPAAGVPASGAARPDGLAAGELPGWASGTMPPDSAQAIAAADQALPQQPLPAAAAAGASYKLLIKPWAMVTVDGVERGPSPPLKHLNLAPGQHTIRIVNPNFPEHTVTLNAVKGASSVIELDFTEEETP